MGEQTKIKICGLTRMEDIRAVNALLPEYIGFVFAPGSKRRVTPEQAGQLKQHLDSRIQAVGVFVDEEPENIARLFTEGIIDMAQLHGRETADDIRRLRQLTDKPIIQAFRADGEGAIQAAASSPADMILLDSGSGGTGECFDWSLPAALDRPYILAGGLNPANIRTALDTLHPYAVDVSSGVETNARKDPRKMEAFVRAVRTDEHISTIPE
jgi:phosphoribosylanthranilate isomerase